VKKTKVGPLINNSDLKLPNGKYSKKRNTLCCPPAAKAAVLRNVYTFLNIFSNAYIELYISLGS